MSNVWVWVYVKERCTHVDVRWALFAVINELAVYVSVCVVGTPALGALEPIEHAWKWPSSSVYTCSSRLSKPPPTPPPPQAYQRWEMDMGVYCLPSCLIPGKLREAFVTKNSSHIIKSNSLFGWSYGVLAMSKRASLFFETSNGSYCIKHNDIEQEAQDGFIGLALCYVRKRKRRGSLKAFTGYFWHPSGRLRFGFPYLQGYVALIRNLVEKLVWYFILSSYGEAELPIGEREHQ